MAKGGWNKLRTNPLGFIANSLRKLFVDPARYGRKGDYDAEGYWRDRFKRHGAALTGPGDEGLSEQENERMYREAADKLLAKLKAARVDLTTARVLEIGCGNGYFTGLLHAQGTRNYLGVDITDVQFDRFRRQWPEFRFAKMDITQSAPGETFDLVLLIDVIQHIVKESKLAKAFEHVHASLAPGGVFLLSPIMDKKKKHLFYVHWWTQQDVRRYFTGYEFSAPLPFRYTQLLTLQKPK